MNCNQFIVITVSVNDMLAVAVALLAAYALGKLAAHIHRKIRGK